MARGGFLGRVIRAIRNVVAPPSPPRREPPPPPEPPREREPGGGPGVDQYRREWRHQDGKGNYRKNKRVFDQMMDDVGEDDPDERMALWKSYIRNIVNGEGQYRRNDSANLFWRDSGIDPQDFNWAKWREAMGYTGKRRSRTP